MKEEIITIEIIGGVEGSCLSINNYRFAGPKPWGGGKVNKQWKVTKEDFIKSLKHIGMGVDTIYELVLGGLMTDGEHHKQWYLEQILKQMGHNSEKIRDVSWGEGVAP